MNVWTVGHIDHGRKVLIWFDEACDVSLEAFNALPDLGIEVVRWDDERVKAFDAKLGCTVSGVLEINDGDHEKLLAMFGPSRILSPHDLAPVLGVDCFGERRGKKGKFKKDWMR